ncbi:hypothetical protein UY3_11115 [Chelonia mydas]|uniref:Uncharacterized protein n=1 Tax=Chelonia mydas TaxID=8469 RepID=M7BI27_CHEMY|nr:hypothetical protein UY3_11115 [Chelonia mydas]
MRFWGKIWDWGCAGVTLQYNQGWQCRAAVATVRIPCLRDSGVVGAGKEENMAVISQQNLEEPYYKWLEIRPVQSAAKHEDNSYAAAWAALWSAAPVGHHGGMAGSGMVMGRVNPEGVDLLAI